MLGELQMVVGTIKDVPKPDILLNKCQKCKIGNRIIIHVFDGRGPPKAILNKLKLQGIN